VEDDSRQDRRWEYVSLSKRFESFANRATNPNLAAAYRSLADHYRILDEWRKKVGDRYETAAAPPDATTTTTLEPARPLRPGKTDRARRPPG
jgi:hypothetical protein